LFLAGHALNSDSIHGDDIDPREKPLGSFCLRLAVFCHQCFAEPLFNYMQARPEKARKFGLAGLNAALDGVRGTTAVHICFGYAAIIHQRPDGYSFLSELAESPVQQVSIETAQSKLDCSVLEKLPGKTIILGTLDLSDMTVEKPETVAARIRRALPYVPAPQIVVAPDCGLKYLPREVAYGKMCAMVEGAGIVRRELAAI
jgi:5-methyltetrahydropteroyltriglutamate--homocysteine methyltransferase